jgi:hypothetical protein
MAWLQRWGFGVLVGAAVIVSLAIAVTVATPSHVPSFALQATPIYRLEAGAAVFTGIYFAALAVVLALHNRGFTEIGVRGVRARGLSGDAEKRMFEEQQSTIRQIQKAIQRMERGEAG